MVCTAAKVNSNNESGFRLNFSRPISLSYTNTHCGAGINAAQHDVWLMMERAALNVWNRVQRVSEELPAAESLCPCV